MGVANPARVARHLVAVCLLLEGAVAAALADLSQTNSGDESILFQEIPPVFAASRFEQTLNEAPASVTVVTADQIARRGYRTLADLLRGVPGFYISYDRNYTYVGVRGVSRPGDFNTRILLLIDGHRVNDAVTDLAYIGTESLVEMNLVDRVEVIRGASSSLYGTNAFLAVINVITRRADDLAGSELELSTGSFGTHNGRLAWGGRLKSGLDLLISASLYRSDGQDLYFPEFDEPQNNEGWARNVDQDKRRHLFMKLGWRRHSLELNLNQRTKQIPTASYETLFNDPWASTLDRGGYLAWNYSSPIANGGQLTLSASYDTSFYQGHYPYSDGLSWDDAKGRWWTGDAQLLQPLGAGHRLTVGTEFRYNALQAQHFGYEGEPRPDFSDARQSSHSAVYLQDEWHISDHLLVNAGLRHDRYGTVDATTSPRLAVIVKPDPASALKLLYGSAFRAPNAYELYYRDGVTQKAPASLEPEVIHAYELAYERSTSSISGALSIYRNRIRDLISLVTDPADDLLVFRNTDRVTAEGAEVQLSGHLFRAARIGGSYSWQRAIDGRTGKRLSNSPNHLLRLDFETAVLHDVLDLAVQVGYTARRQTVAGEDIAGFTTANIALRWQLGTNRPSLTLGIQNLLGRRYADPGGEEHRQAAIPQDGRDARLSLRYRF